MRIPYRTTITFIFFLCIVASQRTTANSDTSDSSITAVNVVDAFSFSEENLKDKLIFSHVLSPHVKTVVLDAGHGGKDRGCKGTHADTKEKEIALALTLKLGAYIESYFPDVNVIYTRKKDVFVTLNQRARIANKAKADLFISIHCNYIRNRPDVLGSETYVMGLHTADHNLNVAMRENAAITLEDDFQKGYAGYDPNSTESHIMLSMFQNAYLERSILFAELVEQQIPLASEGEHTSRGVRQAGFLVLKATAMPSVLVESGYLSHEKDEAYLKTKEGQKNVAFGIFKAFSIYKNVIEGNEVADLQTVAIENKVAESKVEETKTEVVIAEPKKPIEEKISVKPLPKKQPLEKKVKPKVKKSINKDGLDYMIQLAATPTKINLEKSKYASYKGEIVIKKTDGLYKYLLPAGETHEKASRKLIQVRNNGLPKVFISVYKGDDRIKILYK